MIMLFVVDLFGVEDELAGIAQFRLRNVFAFTQVTTSSLR
jgi:hypothetical protein